MRLLISEEGRRRRTRNKRRRKAPNYVFLIAVFTVTFACFGLFVGIQKANGTLTKSMIATGEELGSFHNFSFYPILRRTISHQLDEFLIPPAIQQQQQQQQQQQKLYSSYRANLTFPQLKLDFPYYINGTISTTTAPSKGFEAAGDQVPDQKITRSDICFIKCAYGSSVESVDKADDPKNDVTHFQTVNPTFRFYYFTNLDDLQPPGWTKIMLKALPYKRYITQSRYGKFMAWRLPEIRNTCQVVFYVDGQVRLNQAKSTDEWKELASAVRNSTFGLIQVKHRNDIIQERNGILMKKKDIKENMKITMKWIEEKQGLKTNITKNKVYHNIFFGYDPSNPYYQSLSLHFWEQYSKEVGSWRDQILWAYMLYTLNIVPSPFPPNLPGNEMFIKMKHLEGHGKHTYSAKNDADALLPVSSS